jgi:hypothetical protein
MTMCKKPSFPPVSGSVRRLLLTLTAAFLATALQGQSPAAPAGSHAQPSAQASQGRKPFAPSLPLFFEKNDGQFDGRAGFLARMPNATLYLTGADAVLVHSPKSSNKASAVRMHWAGSSGANAPQGEAEMAGKSNYFIGNDQSRWHTGVANFQRVQERDLYPGVDLVYYGNQQQLEYDLTVHPGASPSSIRLAIEGAKSVSLDKATGDLVLVDAIGSPLRLLKPVVYQLGDNQQKSSISGSYALSAQNTVSFILGDYDHSRPLVIDPEVVYSTMFGGTTLQTANEGTTPNNLYTGMTVDSNGDVYLSGITSTINLPATAGAFQSGCNLYDSGALCSNFFVAKFDPTQSGPASLIYATYIGGNAQDVVFQNDGVKYNIAVDAQFDAYIVGKVSQGIYGSGYPTTSNAYVPTCTVPVSGPTCSGVLTKLNPTGTALLYSTWLADSYSLAEPAMVSVDSNQVAYVAGTGGSGPESFLAAYPTSGGATGSMNYAVGLPFSVMSLAVDPSGNAYVGGESFQGTENGATGYQLIDFNGAVTTLGSGDFPGVFVKFNPSGQNVYATFFGDGSFNGANGVWGVAADPDGIAYATGDDANVVQVNGLPSGAGTTFGAYVAEVDTTQTGAASLLYSTYIYAGDFNNETWTVASNGAGQFAFSGITDGVNSYPLTNPLTQPVAFPTSSPSNPQFIGMIDPSKSGQQALIFLSFIDGVDEALTLFLQPGSYEGGGGGANHIPGTHPKPEAVGISGPPNYNLYVAGYGLAGYVANPFLTGPTLASYSTSLAANQTIAPFFYKIALGPIDCLTVSPYSLAFPTQELGTTSPSLSFTVTNTCTYTVDIASITPSPAFNESDNCTPSLPAGDVCNVNVTFEPTALSPFNGVTYTPTTGLVSVNVTNSNAPLTVAVSGIGVSATTSTGWLSPQNIAFAPLANGEVSAPVTVTYTNTGSVALGNGVTNMIVLSTAASDPFMIVNNGCGKSLAVGANCQFQVEFAPTTTTALYTPSNNYSKPLYAEGQSATLTMTLTGTGGVIQTTPTITWTAPAAITYGTALSGTQLDATATASGTTVPGTFNYSPAAGAVLATGSHTLSVTFTPTDTTHFTTATGSAQLTVQKAAATVTLSNLSQTYTGSPLAATATTNPAGLSVTLTYNGSATAPTAIGSYTVVATINDPNYTGSATGTLMINPVSLSLSSTSLSFGNEPVGDSTAAQNVTVTNTSTIALQFTSIKLGGANKSSFITSNTCGSSIAAGATCKIGVRMVPQATGPLTAAITLTDNAADSPQSIALNGTGITPQVSSLSLSSTSLSFGSEPVGYSTAAQNVIVTNTSAVVLYFNSITLAGTNAASFVTSNTCGVSIAAGATCKIGVRMVPQATGPLTAAITLTDNAADSPQSIALNGTGLTPEVSSLTLSSTSLSFGSETVGISTAAQNVTVTNTSAVVLYFSSITLAGANASSFVTSNTCGTSIAAGATCKIGVRMVPQSTGSLAAAITLTDNAPGSPQTIALAGTGQ